MDTRHFFITTPIYYVNDRPHIGHAYTTVLADVIAGYASLFGREVFFLTGTDEHGQKVQQAAEKRGMDPRAHADEYHLRFKELWKKLNIKYSRFIRTTDEDHRKHVQACLQNLYDRGEIYSREYEGWYSVGEERFFTEDELVEGKDPISGRPVEWLSESNYFFRMGKYQSRLIAHIEEHPDFILPDFRRNEVLGFLRKPLQDLCISRPRSRLAWGIPLPFDSDYVTYVWFDALLNYQSGVQEFKYKDGSSAWPATYHIIGKDILTTHAVYWTTMLMAMGMELPDHILAHGWWLHRGRKQSKSEGNAVNPMDYIDAYGVDPFRYFLMRDMTLGQDASFSDETFISRINSDLANDLGNAINRVNKFAISRFDACMPQPLDNLESNEKELCLFAENTVRKVQELMAAMKLSLALEEVAALVRQVNRYLETRAPWKMAKDESVESRLALGGVIHCAGEALRIALCLYFPVMPKKCQSGLDRLGMKEKPSLKDLKWGYLKGGEKLSRGEGIFPRIDVKEQPADPLVKLDFRVAQITSAENHPDADSLYVLRVDDGSAERVVCAGLKASYEASELKGRMVVLLANLKPARLRGVESCGMLLAADLPDAKAALLDPGSMRPGTELRFGSVGPGADVRANIKDFQKVSLSVQKEKIICGDRILSSTEGEVHCTAPDGASVH